MKVNVVGRNFTVRPDLRDYAEEKARKLDHFFSGIRHIDVIMQVDGQNRSVEIIGTLGRGARLVAKAESDDLMAAIDQAESKMEKQIRRFHARLKAHRDRTRIAEGEAAPPAEEEATYEQVVREMLEDEED